MTHKPLCDCEDCKHALFSDLLKYATALESGIQKLYHLCRDGGQEAGPMAWELLSALATMAEAEDLRSQLSAIDHFLDAQKAVDLRAANRLH